MHFRRLACLLLGVWLGGSVIFAALARRAPHLPDCLGAAETWSTAQLVLAAAVLAVLLFGTHEGKFPILLAAAMLAVALLDRFLLIPEVRPGAQGVNAAGAVLLAAWLLRRRRGSDGVRLQVHAIDEADHRHIDW